MSYLGIVVFVTHILFEKLGEIVRGVEKVDGKSRRKRR
jgi:hypothetical protein